MTTFLTAEPAIATNALLVIRQTPGEKIRVKDPAMLESSTSES
ncbi:hypothetical protein JOC54_002710 [Alkalihalobacillus xiaoxiensis]|uniref:Uncharacterized protein n=1 Tax=Shouchella xiaoxiensis TaxID=766895 RepID=A0ABS2SXE2_9BACI|nr:hypothetical protein [Shouchella xiaoxiensis]MBM7839430.1 hypothetical protein [Shouchella xiaoxiensis]